MTPYDNIPDDKLDEALDELEKKVHRKDAVARRLPRLRAELQKLEREELRLRGERMLEQKDVDKLKKRTPLVLWLTLRGELDERLGKEEREAMEAEARWSAVVSERDGVTDAIRALEKEDRQLGLCREHYAELLERKKQLILSSSGADGNAVSAQQKAASDARARADELTGALDYARRVLALCRAAQELLDAAHEDGIKGVFMNGFYGLNTEVDKYDRIRRAQTLLDSLARLLPEFRAVLEAASVSWSSESFEQAVHSDLEPSDGIQVMEFLTEDPLFGVLALRDIDRGRRLMADLAASVSFLVDDIRPLSDEADEQARIERAKLDSLVRANR